MSGQDEVGDGREPGAEPGGLAGGRGQDAGRSARSPEEHPGAASTTEGKGRTPTGTRVAQVVVLAIAALFAVFALVNSQPVDFSWVFGETRVTRDAAGEVSSGGVPLIVLLLVAFILGAGLGGWWTWQAARSRRQARDGGS
jgi:uncharacterized integral membrane protein